jgi:pimeloyl-ACP methyl ester carboxylesterase
MVLTKDLSFNRAVDLGARWLTPVLKGENAYDFAVRPRPGCVPCGDISKVAGMPSTGRLTNVSRYPGILSQAGLLDLNGVELYVERHLGLYADPHAPPLLALHGVGGSADMMMPEVEGVSADRPVIVYDARGHGRSTRPVRYTIHDHIADVLAIVDALDVDRFAVLGVSMGSYIAPRIAGALPQRLAGLVLVVTKGHGQESSTAQLMRERPELFRGKSQEEIALVMFEIVTSPKTTSEERTALLAKFGAMSRPEVILDPEGFRRANDALAPFDNRPIFAQLTCPTLVISGRDDALNPPAAGEAVAAAIRGARFEIIERAGHILTIERTPEYIALVRSFLERI